MSRIAQPASGSLVLDSEGLTRAIRRDLEVRKWVRAARDEGNLVIASAATLVEVIHPRINRSAIEWTLSTLKVEPVTEQIARRAATLLDQVGRHGHTYAIDAMVAATALAARAPVTLLTSDPDDLRALCGDGVTVIGL